MSSLTSLNNSKMATTEEIASVNEFIKQNLDDFQEFTQENIHENLKDGVILCRLVNSISPDAIPKISLKSLSFLQMENINNFIHACATCDIGNIELFEVADLYENRSMKKVVTTILALKRQVEAGMKPARPIQMMHTIARPKKTQSNVGTGSSNKLSPPSKSFMAASASSLATPDSEFHTVPRPPVSSSRLKAASAFLESLLEGESFPSSDGLFTMLKDGTVLCRLINSIEPNSVVSINTGQALPVLHMENIFNFVQAAKRYGLKSNEIFQTADLYESRDLGQVLACILSLERLYKQKKPISAQSARDPDDSGDLNKESSSKSLAHNTENDTPKKEPVNLKSSLKKAVEASSSNQSLSLRRTVERTSETRGLKIEVEHLLTKTNAEIQLGICIGKGHFGSVYRGFNLSSGALVAVKRIPLETTKQEEIDALMGEVEMMKGFNHENIVKFEGVCREKSHLNIVLEFVEGGSLFHLLKQYGAFSETLSQNYMVGILDGLVYLHNLNVIHLDLKAANILTTKTGSVKLSDFGVSQEFNFEKADTSVVGTPNWMAPEIIELRGSCTASDIWSVGCTLIEILTTKPPYSDCNPMTALFRIVEDDCPPLPPGICNELEDFLSQCLIKDPSKRPSAKLLLEHPWLANNVKQNRAAVKPNVNSEKLTADIYIQKTASPIADVAGDQQHSNAKKHDQKKKKSRGCVIL